MISTQTRIKIMPLGDSITQGFNSSDARGYRTPLWHLAKRARWSVDFVGSLEDEGNALIGRHEGHYGWRIDHLSEYVRPSLQSYQPDVILLHIGTNDIIQRCRAPLALERLEGLLDCIHMALPETMIFVAQITPLGFEALNSRVITYNQHIPELVQRKINAGWSIQSVDMYNAVPITTIKDKIHTDDTGYFALAETWFQALEPWYPALISRSSDDARNLVSAGRK